MFRKHGFTLIELLVVIIIFGILLGMGSVMMGSVRRSSEIARTQAIIAVINEVIDSKIEELRNRPFPIQLQQPTDPNIVRIDLAPGEAALVRLMMLRDTMRMEMPDRFTDLVLVPGGNVNQFGTLAEPLNIRARARAVFIDPNATPQLIAYPVDWWEGTNIPNHNIPGLLSAYRARIPVSGNQVTWTPAFSSSECLYLMMSTSFIGGVSAIEMLPNGYIRDSDEDGMPEIVDGWGNPIGFIRWPVGYLDVNETALPTSLEEIVPEEGDVFRADFAYAVAAAGGTPSAPLPRSLRPLVVSAGPDGIFDLRFSQTDSNGRDISYSLQDWVVSPATVGPDNVQGRDNVIPYIDPYLRRTSSFGLIGEFLDEDGDGSISGATDNITNYSLRAEE